VLVHGGWADSSGWNAEVTKLEQLGYPVIAPANPLRSLASDADYIRSVFRTINGPVVLVGHSYGGAVISNAAVGVANVKALVYIAGFASDKGESLIQLVTKNPRHTPPTTPAGSTSPASSRRGCIGRRLACAAARTCLATADTFTAATGPTAQTPAGRPPTGSGRPASVRSASARSRSSGAPESDSSSVPNSHNGRVTAM
jgi:pimeloyl-ACP methyl ester carboxylesterase